MKLAALLLLAVPAWAQVDLQILDAGGARPAPQTCDLGSMYAGESLQARFRLRNLGKDVVTITTLTVAGVGFTLAGPGLPATLPADSALDFAVSFRANSVGSYSAVLRAHTTTALLVAAVLPRLTWLLGNAPLPLTVDFGAAERGSSLRRTITALNETAQRLTVPAIAVSGADFSIVGVAPSGEILDLQQSAAFEVEFRPSAAGVRSGQIVLGDRSYALTGIGVEPPLPHPQLSLDLKQAANAQQGRLLIAFDPPSQTAGKGVTTLDFLGAADPAVAFASGGRTAVFEVAVGDTSVALPFQTGTTAGKLTFSVELGGSVEALSVTIPNAPPVLIAVEAARAGQSIEVRATGYDNTRSISELSFSFYSSATVPIAFLPIDVDATAEFSKFFAASDGGGAFLLRAVFPVTGDIRQVDAVELAVTDMAGKTVSPRVPIR